MTAKEKKTRTNWKVIIFTSLIGVVLALAIPSIWDVVSTVTAQPRINKQFEIRFQQNTKIDSLQNATLIDFKNTQTEDRVYLRMIQEDVTMIKEKLINQK